ncbi:MAG TPA: hypothetical protein VGM50_21165 [Gemmatimonadaceae bacterium]
MSAQSPRDTLRAIPRDLVEGLLMPFNLGFGNANEFTVGDVPPSLKPFVYVPHGAHVIGGLDTRNAVYVVMTSAAPVAEVTAEFRREQPKLGWTTPPAANRTWGFISAQGATMDNAGLQFCHINQSLEIRPYGRPGTTQISIVVQNNGGRCGSNMVAYPSQPMTSLLPVLENPIGTTMNAPACFQLTLPTPGATGTTERVQSTLSNAQLLDAFAKQLADSGWKSGDTNGGTIRRTWTRADSGDVMREITLQASPMSGTASSGCTDVQLNVRRVPKPR